MRTKVKKLLAIVLSLSLCMGNMMVVSADKETGYVDDTDYTDDWM